MANCGIKLAFCLCPFHLDDFDLFESHFQGAFYIDRALPMGCSISCTAFECFSSFLEWNI